MRYLATVGLLTTLAAVVVPEIVAAQTAPLARQVIPIRVDSGVLAGAASGDEFVVVFDDVVSIDGADWIRLSFDHTTLLQGQSVLRLTSLFDGAVQTLDTTHLDYWRNTSAYFNGSGVRVELVAAPGTWGNRVAVEAAVVNGVPEPPVESQCGGTDDRQPSEIPERARLLDIGCTASVVTEGSCFLTAGHCTGNMDVVEFNVPPSLANRTIQHPGPEDQYPAESSPLDSENGGVGRDWGFFVVHPNSETGLTAWEAQGKLDLAESIPPLGSDVTIVGYGIDDGVRNQVQQIHNGPLVAPGFPDALEYQVDTEGGNSGSPVTRTDTGDVVAVHTHAGCDLDDGDGNQGTSILKADLQQAYQTLCPVGTPFGLAPPVPGLPGVENDWAFDSATPGATVWVIFGRSVGTTTVPGCGGVKISIEDARPVGNTVADGTGAGIVSRRVPDGANGAVYFQAVDMSNCTLSERVRVTFAP